MESLRTRVERRLRPRIGPPIRRLRYRGAMLRDRIRPQVVEGKPVPPPVLRRLSGPHGFLDAGKGVVAALERSADLRADDRVLEVGCGPGRVALALLDVLGPDGGYDGIEIVPEAVVWCQRRITPLRPSFRFHRADVHNDHYHRGGATAAEHYRFPFDDDAFDLVFLSSVFTHLGTAPTRRYVEEAARVLRPGGRLYATFFLVDDAATDAMASGRTEFRFVEQADGSLTADPRDPDAAVAHREAAIVELCAQAGFRDLDIGRGRWSGRPDGIGLQDQIVARQPRG